MNAIPQRAYDNYERIQLPRKINDVQRGRISDMEAYRMQKIAAERRRLGFRTKNMHAGVLKRSMPRRARKIYGRTIGRNAGQQIEEK